MRSKASWTMLLALLFLFSPMMSFSRTHHHHNNYYDASDYDNYVPPFPSHIAPPGEKVIIVDPNIHGFAAYMPDGTLAHSGLATAGSDWCRDLHRRCHTRSGTFRIYSLGSAGCISHKFPLPRGGAPMPYCMYFNHGQALHGSPEGEVVYGNISHGCVRLHVEDAKWLRFDFVDGPDEDNDYRGTKVIIRPY